jgi:hypothetical protein
MLISNAEISSDCQLGIGLWARVSSASSIINACLYLPQHVIIPRFCCVSTPRILPLPLRNVMREKNDAGGGWIGKDTIEAGPLQTLVGRRLGGGLCAEADAGLRRRLWQDVEKGSSLPRKWESMKFTLKICSMTFWIPACAGMTGKWLFLVFRSRLDEKSVALLTHEPHPQQKSSL